MHANRSASSLLPQPLRLLLFGRFTSFAGGVHGAYNVESGHGVSCRRFNLFGGGILLKVTKEKKKQATFVGRLRTTARHALFVPDLTIDLKQEKLKFTIFKSHSR